MTTYTTLYNQSMWDVAIAATGSENAIMQICADNDMSVSGVLLPGTEVMITDAALALGNVKVRNELAKTAIGLGTASVAFTEAAEVYESDDGNVYISDGGDEYVVNI